MFLKCYISNQILRQHLSSFPLTKSPQIYQQAPSLPPSKYLYLDTSLTLQSLRLQQCPPNWFHQNPRDPSKPFISHNAKGNTYKMKIWSCLFLKVVTIIYKVLHVLAFTWSLGHSHQTLPQPRWVGFSQLLQCTAFAPVSTQVGLFACISCQAFLMSKFLCTPWVRHILLKPLFFFLDVPNLGLHIDKYMFHIHLP